MARKNSCGSKIPLPPNNFSNGPSLSDDDMIYTYVNMHITFVTPVMDFRDQDQV